MEAKYRAEVARYRQARSKRWSPERTRAHRNADEMLRLWRDGWELPSVTASGVFPHVYYRTPDGGRHRLERRRAPRHLMKGEEYLVWWYRSPVPGVPLGWFWERLHREPQPYLNQAAQYRRLEIFLTEALQDPAQARAVYEAHRALHALAG